MKLSLFFIASLLTLSLKTSIAVVFDAINNAEATSGGTRFDQEIGTNYSKQVMSNSSDFIWSTFKQGPDDRKNVDLVTLSIETMSINGVVAVTSNNKIRFSADYMASYSGDVNIEFTGVIYHEMTHVWQWDGQGNAPSGLIEGIADFVRLKAGYKPSTWGQPGEGTHWDDGYDTTAYFLDYCNRLVDGFVAKLNAKMRDGYTDDFFVQLLGKSVNQLWSDYKASDGGKGESAAIASPIKFQFVYCSSNKS